MERDTERTDSDSRLTGGYGGEPLEEEQLDDAARTSRPDDPGSSLPESGRTVEETDTSLSAGSDDAS